MSIETNNASEQAHTIKILASWRKWLLHLHLVTLCVRSRERERVNQMLIRATLHSMVKFFAFLDWPTLLTQVIHALCDPLIYLFLFLMPLSRVGVECSTQQQVYLAFVSIKLSIHGTAPYLVCHICTLTKVMMEKEKYIHLGYMCSVTRKMTRLSLTSRCPGRYLSKAFLYERWYIG